MSLILRSLLGVWALLWATVVMLTHGVFFILGSFLFPRSWWTEVNQRVFLPALLFGVFARVRVEGRENIPVGRACIVMANHRSYLDISAMVAGLKGLQIRFVAKRELLKMPLFGWILGVSDHVMVDRADRKQAVAALRRASAKMSKGIAVTVFPEGTRAEEARLLPFKKGGFHVARDAGFPILPVSIQNSGRVLGKKNLLPRPGVITLVVHPLVETAGRERSEIPQIMIEVRERILSGLPRALAAENAENAEGSDAGAGSP